MELDPAMWALVVLATAAAGLVQGTTGLGFGLVLAPVLSIADPEAVPVTVILLAVPLALVMTAREHRHIDYPGFVWMLLGRIPGTALGVVLVVVSGDAISVVVGVIILVAVTITALRPAVEPRPPAALTAGVASGLMATTSAAGGPPLALLYQHRAPAVLRSTLAISFVAGLAFSILGLGLAGEVTLWKLRSALVLLPAMLAGLAISTVAARHVGAWFRPAVLTVAAVAAVAAVARGLA